MESRGHKQIPTMTAVGLLACCFSCALFLYWSSSSPTTPDPATGCVCALNQHGHVFYVTRLETVVFHTLLIGGWILAAAGIVKSLNRAR
jgi:hypothetical protein